MWCFQLSMDVPNKIAARFSTPAGRRWRGMGRPLVTVLGLPCGPKAAFRRLQKALRNTFFVPNFWVRWKAAAKCFPKTPTFAKSDHGKLLFGRGRVGHPVAVPWAAVRNTVDFLRTEFVQTTDPSPTLGELVTNAKKVTVSVLYWYGKLFGQIDQIFRNIPKGIFFLLRPRGN